QEALTNVARHARASTVRVELAHGRDVATLTIADDGDGFTPTDASGHGLAIMGERLAAAGGTVAVRSTPGTGTEITLEWPASAERGHR
ncbi:MAG: ATP-binding protein, partial [Acidimicrobiales bacterium]